MNVSKTEQTLSSAVCEFTREELRDILWDLAVSRKPELAHYEKVTLSLSDRDDDEIGAELLFGNEKRTSSDPEETDLGFGRDDADD